MKIDIEAYFFIVGYKLVKQKQVVVKMFREYSTRIRDFFSEEDYSQKIQIPLTMLDNIDFHQLISKLNRALNITKHDDNSDSNDDDLDVIQVHIKETNDFLEQL